MLKLKLVFTIAVSILVGGNATPQKNDRAATPTATNKSTTMNTSVSPPLTVTYIGGPTAVIEIGGFRIMTDPTLDPKGTSFRLNATMTEEKLSGPAGMTNQPIDVVLLSHDQHFDNLDNSGREYLTQVKTTLTTKAGSQRLKGNSVGLAPGDYKTFSAANGDQIKITATPARHGPAGIEKISGDVIGFYITVSGHYNYDLYVTGDTVYYNEIEKLGKSKTPRYVFIFAGAARPRGPFNLTMGTNDALDTAHAFPDATLIPLHSEGWTHYTENNASLVEAFSILGISDKLLLLDPGIPTPLAIN